MDDVTKVAIIGGGCAGMATAFELTKPEQGGRFDVTVYQQGWRLGGKGASGRRAPTQRIEEHGLHLWMGFYENAFRLIRECYAELDRDPSECPIATFEDAFKPDNFVGVTEQTGDGAWRNWNAFFPPAAGTPGDPLQGSTPFSVPGYLTRCVLLLRTLITSVQDRVPPQAGENREDLVGAIAALIGSTVKGLSADPAGSIRRIVSYGQLAVATAIAEAADILRNIIERPDSWRGGDDHGRAVSLLGRLSILVHHQIDTLASKDAEVSRIWEIVDVVLAIIRGILRDGLVLDKRGFDAIDDMDWRKWLEKHGAAQRTLESAFIRGSYDLLFAYKDGNIKDPQLAAGIALRGSLRMFFTYRGALFWKMQAGMGDIVFAPLYEVLRRRGVKFEFFHRLDSLKLGPEKDHVARIEMTEQAKIKDGKPYEPLVNIKDLPCWPSEPDYDQLVNGDALRKSDWNPETRWGRKHGKAKTLEVGRDFDFAVLATGLGEVPVVAEELLAASTDWQQMVDKIGTVATQAFQVWLDTPVEELGWTLPQINISGYVEPFDTWADMRQLVPVEEWKTEPQTIAYFCSVLPDSELPKAKDQRAGAHETVRQNAVDFLKNHVGHFWPGAMDDDGFRWSLLSHQKQGRGKNPVGEARFDTQFWQANVDPTERYVLSLPGSLQYRISPLEMHFDNLTIAGDWTDCSHYAGCVEAAVMSGLLASHALSTSPPLQDIIAYDHP